MEVDIVVGLQYGDEGKGAVAALLADKTEYVWTGRVGGQNAEHRFVHNATEFCARILPSAAADRGGRIWAVLGAGHCFNPDLLAVEARHLEIPLDKIFVDRNAMWLRPEHARQNRPLAEARGSTGWGIGAALAEKVLRNPATRLIGDARLPPAVSVGVAAEFIRKIGSPGLLEGSQGALLSLNHGHYPYCTGKDVTAPALCAEMGISHRDVRRVIGVIRLAPMRVPGNSGPAGGRELSYDEVEKAVGVRIPQHRRVQGDSGAEERLFEFDMKEVEYSAMLNGVTDIAVTFADYHRPGNYRVRQWEQLHPDTKKLLQQLEDNIAPVILVRTGQGEHDIIWNMEENKWKR